MAILNKIRQRTVFLIVIIALALFSFVLADLIKQGGFTSNKSLSNIGVVGDEEISREEFVQIVENRVQQSQGRVSTIQAVNQVWDSKVYQMLLDQEFESLGLQVGQDQIINVMAERLAGNPQFSNEAGFFDEAKMKQYVAEIKLTSPQQYQQWLDFEESIETIAKSELYYDMIKAGIGATKLEAKQAYKQQNDRLNIDFVKIPYTKAADVEVSKADIKAYINQNKTQFKQEAERDIKLVHFKEEPSAEDFTAVEDDLKELLTDREEYDQVSDSNQVIQGFKTTDDVEGFVNRNSDVPFADVYTFNYNLKENKDEILALTEGEVLGPIKSGQQFRLIKMLEQTNLPDSIKLKHILVTYEGTGVDPQVTRTQDEAKALADSLQTLISNDIEQFGDLAEKFSADRQSAGNGGDLNWVTYGRLVEDFNDYVFDQQPNHKGVVETEFGYHVVYVEDKTEPKPAVKLATIVKTVNPSELTLNNLYRKASNFELAAEDASLEEAAKAEDLKVKPVNNMKALDETISGLGQQRSIVKWAFSDEAKVGSVKRFDISNGYVVAELVNATNEGVQSVEEASATVTPILKKQKQAEELIAQIESKDLNSIASKFEVSVQKASAVNMSSPVLPGSGSEPKVVGAAFALDENGVSQPIQGEKGVYVIKLTGKQPAAELPSYVGMATQETKRRIQTFDQKVQPTSRNYTNPKLNPVYKALKEGTEIEDKRTLFY